MRALKYIRRSGAIRVEKATVNGGEGEITIGRWAGTVIWNTNERGWEHVSVHPPKSKYVNIMPNCLHLRRPVGGIRNMDPEWDEI